jgi:hypothetical protein
MVDFIGAYAIEQPREIERIGKIAVVEKEADTMDVGVGVKVIDPRRVEGRSAPDDSVDFVPLFQEEIGEITPVLAGDTRDERFLHEGAQEMRERRSGKDIFTRARG